MAVCGLLCGLGGCAGSFLNILSPELLDVIGLGSGRAASLPDEAPALLAIIENQTDRVLDAEISFRLANDAVETLNIDGLSPGQYRARAIPCVVAELTFGDLSDLDASGARIRLGGGGVNDPFISVEAFGALLKDGVNYDCGDSVRFVIRPSTLSGSGYQVIAFIQRAPTNP